MTVSLFIATTLDGYIATTDDDLHWLFDVEGEGDNGYGAFYAGVDVVLMGKRTYDWLKREQPDTWAYAGKMTYVLTRQKLANSAEVQFISEQDLPDLVEKLKSKKQKLWVVGGGQVIRLFLENGWVDELQITVAPVLLGTGIPLFPSGAYAEKLQLLGSKNYGQFVELHYQIKKED
ncbi:dihydrofolate reductase family protein [Lactococcus kimchii]|uniref:dihydrofolate reductase family protein n=1 Tax=Lactococcus sp. S-13 TaxID=2507158 RepID=UPI001023C2F1|nr:dihydrofolate reductase family protein [Lactococcus sp. S-13]RZI49126.1 dihydrofolate reductase [Lactococcus sp. S-13]